MSENTPNPAALNADNLHDYREEISEAEDAPLEAQLELLQNVAADLQKVLNGESTAD